MALTTNLVSYYKLDSNSNDSLGSNNGTDTGVSYANAGIIGNCATYSGSSGSYTDIGTGIVPTTAMSVSLWINCSNTTSYQGIAGRTDATSVATTAEIIRISGTTSGKIEWQVCISPNPFTAESTTVLSNNTWYHIVGTWDGSSGNLKLYINGSLEKTVTSATGTLNSPAGINRIFGKYGTYNGGLFYGGKIDEIGYWTRELSSTEVTQLYNGGAGLSYPFTTGSTANPAFLAQYLAQQ